MKKNKEPKRIIVNTAMKLGDLKGHPENPRKITQKELEILKKGLELYGNLADVTFNRRNQKLVCAHQRITVMPPSTDIIIDEKFDPPTAKGTVALGHFYFDGERFSYREVDWDDDTHKAAALIANKAGGKFENKLVADWLLDLDAKGWEIENTGFTLEEFEDICAPFKPEEPYDPAIDELPSGKDVKTRVELGDLWQLGDHRLLCGDSTVKENVDRLMGGEKADMVFTDPPYGISYDDTKHSHQKGFKASRFGMIEGDDKEFEFPIIDGIEEQFWWGANYYCQQLPKNGSWFVWDKKTEAMQTNKMLFTNDFELCWSKKKHKSVMIRKVWAGAINKEKGEDRLHPTQKPVSLCEYFISEFSKNIVLDIYLGSGSTLIACEKTNRKCYGMEIDPHYCDVILARWEKFSGKKAVKL